MDPGNTSLLDLTYCKYSNLAYTALKAETGFAMRMKLGRRIIPYLFLTIFLSGCATLRTVPHFTLNTPKLYSGTRMDVDAMRQKRDYILKKYNVDPPTHPRLDLPFSFIFDTAILFPVTLPIAIAEAVFE
jgi:uncharacterized protein YceK